MIRSLRRHEALCERWTTLHGHVRPDDDSPFAREIRAAWLAAPWPARFWVCLREIGVREAWAELPHRRADRVIAEAGGMEPCTEGEDR